MPILSVPQSGRTSDAHLTILFHRRVPVCMATTLCSRSSASFHINQTMAACASFMVINLAVVARRSVWMLAHSRCMTLFILVAGRVPIMGVPVSAGARKFKINQFPTTNNKASHRASGSSMHAMHAREETWGCCGMTRFFYGKLFLPISSTTR